MFLTQNVRNVIIKSILSIVVLYTLTKIMGKKQIAQLNMFDYIVGITIGSIAGELSIKEDVSALEGIASLAIWGLTPVLISFINLKSTKLRGITEGTPTILVKEGKIIKSNLKKANFTVNDLLEELRVKGYFNVYEIRYAILETNGQISVLEKNKVMSVNVIIDGHIIYKNLEELNLSKEWLLRELRKNKINNEKNVFLASIDENKKLFINLQDK